jgi:hypothetical protein
VAGFDKFSEAAAEHLISRIHLEQARLVLAEGDVEVIHGLRGSGANGDERRRIVQRPDGNDIALALNLRCEEADAARHLFYATDLADKGTLEGGHIGVELWSERRGSVRRTRT